MRLQLLFLFLSFYQFGFTQAITYSKHIAPLVDYHCAGCHYKGGVAPIPFSTYEEVSSYATMIAYVTSTKYMPPWKAVHPKNAFQAERGLSDKQIELIQQWIDGGLQEGEKKDKKIAFPPIVDKMADPDVVYAMAEAFQQYGVYYDQFRVFVIPTNLGEDREVASIAFVPGNKTIVRSCQVSIDTSSKSKALDDWDPQYGYFSFGELGFVPMESRWYNWHPKKPVTHFPEGTGKLLPKGSKILLHVHYGPTGFPQKDSSYLQIKFSKKKIKQPVFTAPLIHPYNMTNDTFFIPANETTRVHAKFIVPFDMLLQGVFPHSHLLGRKWEVFTVDPQTNKSEVLLEIDDWDFKWKQMYDFTEAKILKKGTVVHALATYDNTLDNLSNPSNPPHNMQWGKRMFEELFLVFFKFSVYQPNNINPNIEIQLSQVNVTSPNFKFNVVTSASTPLDGHIISFDGVHRIPLFENQNFEKGRQVVDVSLCTLPFGNYYIELADPSTGEKVQRVFLYLEDGIFE